MRFVPGTWYQRPPRSPTRTSVSNLSRTVWPIADTFRFKALSTTPRSTSAWLTTLTLIGCLRFAIVQLPARNRHEPPSLVTVPRCGDRRQSAGAEGEARPTKGKAGASSEGHVVRDVRVAGLRVPG